MTDRELFKMALDALNNFDKGNHGMRWQVPIIKALRSRLANEFNPDWNQVEALQESLREHMAEIQRLRARLAQPEPLAQFKFQEYSPPNWGDFQVTKSEFVAEQKAMNEALRKMVEQEEDYDAIANKQLASLKAAAKVTFEDAVVRAVHKLYNAPPQREWQGLAENEIKHLWYEACQTNLELTSQLIVHLARNIEAKLKEKNNG